MGKAAPCGVAVHGVVGERAGIRLVVADDEVGIGTQRRDQRLGQTWVAIPQDAGMPWARMAAPDRRETVDRDEHRRMPGGERPVDRRVDGIVIGRVEAGDAPRPLVGIDAGIAGHDGAVGKAHDERRIVLAAVGIDQQPRERRQHRRHAEPLRQAAADRGRARIVGNVALELGCRQAEVAILRRQTVLGVVANDQQSGRRVSFDQTERLKIAGLGCGGLNCGNIHRARIIVARPGPCQCAIGHDPAVFCADKDGRISWRLAPRGDARRGRQTAR